MRTEFLTSSPSQTKKLGEVLAKEILKTRPGKNAWLFGLVGDLGGGKTTLIQGLARGLGIKEKILSPTFIIMRYFELRASNFERFYHIDCYRIKKPKEILNLGFEKIVADPKNIIAIEWADRIKKIMFPKTIWLNFELIDNKTRKIVIQLGYGKQKTAHHH